MAFESRIDARVADAFDHEERVASFTESSARQMAADDDVLADGLSDALYDPRTRRQLIELVRAGDLLEAMRVMHTHATTTYIAEAAEVAAHKRFRT